MNPFDLPGPQFLVVYLVFAAAALAGLYLVRRNREAGAAPSGQLRDPYLVACLRGGAAEVVRVATLGLIDRGLLGLSGKVVTVQPGADATRGLANVEREVLSHFRPFDQLDSVFRARRVLATAESDYGVKLRHLGLLPDSDALRFRALAIVVAIALIAGVAGIKIAVALDRGRSNIGFLIVLAVVAVIIAVKVGNPFRTSLGSAVLRDLRSLFSGLRGRAAAMRQGSGSTDLLWLAAVFGMTAVPTAAFPFVGEFRPRPDSGSSGGCGSSSSGDGGGCGGGGGGGGCGGCGS
jgi:uncharacterized protein (TIGR04222 family)